MVGDGGDSSSSRSRPPPATLTRSMSGASILSGPPDGKPVGNKDTTPVSKFSRQSDMDLLPRVKGMYRLLELFTEQGSGGVVDKIIISQDSVSDLVNELSPGAYSSLTKIDFTSLDQVILQPIGLYGSLTSLVDFIEELGAINAQTKALLLAPPNEAGRPQPNLKTGIYFIPDKDGAHSKNRDGYVIYWPEYTTWDDDAISTVKRNRVTFMRYLTKLSDQVVSLVSRDHSESLVWAEEQEENTKTTDKKKPATHNRLYTFAVQKTKEQEESVAMHDGFNVSVPLFDGVSFAPEDAHLAPRIVSGEVRQAIISGQPFPERVVEQKIRRNATKHALTAQLREHSTTIRLEDTLSVEGVNNLFELGLRTRHKKIGDAWRKDMSDLRHAQEDALTKERHDARDALNADIPRLKQHIKDQLVCRLVEVLPFVKDSLPVNSDAQIPTPAPGAVTHKLPMLHPELFHRAGFENITSPVFQQLKSRLVVATEAVQGHDVSDEEYAALDEATFTGKGYMEIIKRHLGLVSTANDDANGTYLGSFVSTAKAAVVWTAGFHDDGESTVREHLRRASRTVDDANILNMARMQWINKLPRSCNELLGVAIGNILEKLEMSSNTIAHRMSGEQFRANESIFRGKVDSTFKGMIESRLQRMKEEINKAEIANYPGTRVWKVHSLVELPNAWGKTFQVVETAQFTEAAHVQYSVVSLDLSQTDTHAINADVTHVPKPICRPNARWYMQIPITSTLRHVHLFQNKRCLVVVDDHQVGKVNFFLEEDNYIAEAIKTSKMKKIFDLPRVGDDYLLSVNEAKRLVAIYNRKGCRLHVYSIDEHFMSLQSRSADIDLRRWINGGDGDEAIQVLSLTFLLGSEELAFVDTTGQARIFSLVTEQFRPASLILPFVPSTTLSSPDGSCLYFVEKFEDHTDFRIYHTGSFGTNQDGTALTLPSYEWAGASLTSFVSRSNPYVLMWSVEESQLISKRFHIKNRISEFSFKAQDRPRQRNGGKETKHNSLLDVHAEIWTKFPVSSTIERSSPASHRETPLLQFITDSPNKHFASYFRKLIAQFEKGTQKPTEGKLEAIEVNSIGFGDMRNSGLGFDVTSYPAGKWLVELLCLIPIHLAITAGNRFIPLANGVTSAEFERSLLGADVMQIANSITLGWYESIFASYMATKPVKVVSSMGEQSVGKSYALNHFVDTSFAGSAMRCTEGAWLSVTPTDDELIVALDFEGIHSIERSAQEDMLLVLLNVAVSNLVLFRNNFALSRDLAGLFTSFQSSTSLINPEQNPTLFRSILCIIIKDVTDGDADEIVGEFYGKFQRIVQDEQEGNFISKLHRGQLDILPWPVIQSQEFYDLMGLLKERLDGQECSHGNASMFLQTLKTLMAKLKASDWGSLDQNLASYRAQILQSVLNNAFIFGLTETDASDGRLKNLDTDEVIDNNNDTDAVFWLQSADETDPYARRDALLKLRDDWSTDLERQHTPEADYVLALAGHLQTLVTTRILHVGAWIDSNLSRFSSEHADIQNLRRQFETQSRALAAGVEICAMKCLGCGLRCVEGKRHDGEHDCGTTHRCIHQCALDKERGCGLPAGHQGEHICDVKKHLCGQPCSLDGKTGCQGDCIQPVNHSEGEHRCAAESHACGENCHLHKISRDGKPLCNLPCTVDCRTPHERHSCENRLTCPVKCELCPRLCATADHSHVLQNGAVHLCGQEHPCQELCASPGICHVATEPRSVESTFVGKNERFQFTKYTQVANRLACVHRIPKNKLRHDGPHAHSARKDVFHFCETRCPYCQYVCSLPLGHPQEHSTSHGSMEQTTWALDGDADAVREIQGRKFSAGDSGAPMLCSMVCKELGRHAHIAYCRSARAADCTHREVQHIAKRMGPEPNKPKDWITHALYWARSGFKDPYAIEEQTDFAKCDSECAGEEHRARDETPAKPSFCTQPMFHAPATAAARSVGYVSNDGHVFECRNPAVTKSAFHVIFIVDRSGSMQAQHCRPLTGTPVSARIQAAADNCYGAVLSALYGFWTARETAAAHSGTVRRDAYSIVLEGTAPETVLQNDFSLTADELLNRILTVSLNHNNDFAGSIREAQRLMEAHWSTERTPVVIFLSDGIWTMPSSEMNNISRRAVVLGKPMPFHAVFFGSRDSTPSVLSQMADIARNVYTSAKRGREADSPATACTYTNAINTIQLSQTFLGLAESMRQTRSALVRS